MTDNDIAFSVRDFFRFVWRGLPVALLLALVAAALVFLVSSRAEPVYRASATLLNPGAKTTRDFDGSLSTPPLIDAGIYRAAVLEGPITAEALATLEAANRTALTPEKLLDMTQVTTEKFESSSLINITTESTSATFAAEAANALARALLNWDRGRATWQLSNATASLETQIRTLDEQIASFIVAPSQANRDQLNTLTRLKAQREGELSLARVLNDSPIGLLEPFTYATPPGEAVANYLGFRLTLAALIGGLLGYGLLLLRALLDTRVRHAEELSALVGAPVIAEFVKQPRRTRRLPVESSNYLRINLLNTASGGVPKVVLVTSPTEGEGKSSVAISLAESFARSDHRTLLVDADLRKPVISAEYSLDPGSVSLQQYLREPLRPFTPVHASTGTSHQLDIVPSFPAGDNASDLLGREFPALLETWGKQYDIVVLDSAPLLSFADTLTFVSVCSGVVLTVSLRDSNYQSVSNATDLLRRTGVNIFGVAVTKVAGTHTRYARRKSGEMFKLMTRDSG